MNLELFIAILSIWLCQSITEAMEKCSSEIPCVHPKTSEVFLPGETFYVGCKKCTCHERRNKVLTCYREAGGVLDYLRSVFLHPPHYYVDIYPFQIRKLACPPGLHQMEHKVKKTIFAEFFLSYVLIGDKARCCMKSHPMPVSHDEACMPMFSRNKCDFVLVQKSNKRRLCPITTTTTYQEKTPPDKYTEVEHSGL